MLKLSLSGYDPDTKVERQAQPFPPEEGREAGAVLFSVDSVPSHREGQMRLCLRRRIHRHSAAWPLAAAPDCTALCAAALARQFEVGEATV